MSCVMAGYPGTIASTWQRAGRAGRRTGQSAAVMVASSAPIDQFVVRHPSYLLRRLARARARQSRQPAHPRRSREVRGVRAAVHDRGDATARSTCRRCSACCRNPAWCIARAARTRDRAVALDERVVSGQRREPAVDLVGQLRRSPITRAGPKVIGETDFTSALVDAAPQGHLHGRRADVPGRGARLRRPQGATSARWIATTTRPPSPTRR